MSFSLINAPGASLSHQRVLGPQGVSAATPSVLHTQHGQGREMGNNQKDGKKKKKQLEIIHSYFSP